MALLKEDGSLDIERINKLALEEYMEVKEQHLTKVNRKGYTIVEWGGTRH